MPKYRYAFAPDGQIVDVLELIKGNPEAAGSFHCAGCGEPVFPKLKNDQRVKHFVHKVQQISCSEETYLHQQGCRRCLMFVVLLGETDGWQPK